MLRNKSIEMYINSVFLIWVSLAYAAAGGNRKTVTVTTYNAALLEQVASDTRDTGSLIPRAERRDAIINQLNKTFADVTCMQEVWFAEDLHIIAEALKSRYPYTYSYVHDEGGNVPLDGFSTVPPCLDLGPFADCIIANCSTAGSTYNELIGCAFVHCQPQLVVLSDDCWACIRTSGPGFSDILQRCTALLPGPYRKMNIPGLLLLSRRPMRRTSYTDLHPGTREIVPRGYLQAEVKKIGQVVCTHTTSYGLSFYFEFDLQAKTGINSFAEQGLLEIQTLVDRFSHLKRVFLAGDFNVGPAIAPGVSARQPEIFSVLARAFCADLITQCTFCIPPENDYNLGQLARTIDHIFFKGWKSLRKKRLFDDVTVGDGLPLSDHFGVIQKFTCKKYKKHH